MKASDARTPSALGDDDVCLDLSVDGPRAEPLGDRPGSRRRSLSHTCVRTGLDLVAQGRSQAISNGRHTCRCRATTRRNRLEAWHRTEPRFSEVARNRCQVEIAVRRARQEKWGICGKEGGKRRSNRIGKLVFLDAISDIEQQSATVPEHAPCFGHRARFVREEHHAKLADNDVETRVVER
jgi:hypothetical protein